MGAVQRNGDANNAGGVVSSSGTVLANNKPVTVNGDSVSSHAPFIAPHVAAKTANGSTNVFVGGIGVNRTGDADTCTHTRAGGSSNVFVNGQ